MKKLTLLFLLLFVFEARAQRWERRIGLNVGPLIHGSLEATYELVAPNRRVTGFVSSGYTFGIVSKQRGELDAPGRQMISLEQRLTGPFAKVGGRVYLNPRSQWRVFLGGAFIAARYRFRSEELYTVLEFTPGPNPVYERNSTKTGWTTAVAGLVGITRPINPRIHFDAGIQSARPLDGQAFLPGTHVDFRPGIGLGVARFPAQLIVAASYRLGKP